MIEFKLLDFNESNWDLLVKLYGAVLAEDRQYHFFFEGDYSILRMTNRPSTIRKLKKWLREQKIKFEEIGEWVDNIKITRRHQHIFGPLFHYFSELAIHSEDHEFWDIADRVTHCYLNMNHVRMLAGVNKVPAITNESVVLAMLSNMRAFTQGHQVGTDRAMKIVRGEEVKNGD